MTRWQKLLFLPLATFVLLGGRAALGQAANSFQRGAPDAPDWQTVVLVIGAVVGIIMLFAQVKLFSIASSLKEILEELRKKDRKEQPAEREEPVHEGPRTCKFCREIVPPGETRCPICAGENG